jgi:16S rRNA C967 or C1407 C5-methylase (RsmB/RsmF family)
MLPNGIVVGVDIAKHRLGTCHAIIEKYGVNNAWLSLDDGTAWTPLVGVNWFTSRKIAKRPKTSADERAVVKECPGAFDKVLVDVQCSHDGVAKFNHKLNERQHSGRQPQLPDENRLAELQTALLKNGFRWLRDGGTLVYSTCFLSKIQNEEIIDRFLKDEPEAVLDPLPLQPAVLASRPAESDRTWRFAPVQPSYLETWKPLGSGGFYCTARFDPSTSETSGFFVASVRRQSKCT